jgi:hypothetical protein
MSGPSPDPVIQTLQVLTSGTGYNFYDRRNMMRADDLLVRQRASGALADGARALAAQEVAYRRRFIPPATREAPYPPPGVLDSLQALGRLRARLDDLAAQIVGMPVPAQDTTWWRFREEKATLARLLDLDSRMLLETDEVARLARTLTADAWHGGASQAAFDGLLTPLDDLVRARAQFLGGG